VAVCETYIEPYFKRETTFRDGTTQAQTFVARCPDCGEPHFPNLLG
jgi:uncharacterized OB-fold protein